LAHSPGYRWRNLLSCVRVSTLLRGKRSPAAISPSSVSSFLRRSVLYPLASHLALFLAAIYPRYATLICLLSPLLDTSAWVEITLALVGDIVVQ